MANEHNLIPFNSTEEGRARARELGAKGGRKRAANAAAKADVTRAARGELITTLTELTERFNRDDLGNQAAGVAQMLMGRIANGEIEVSGRDVSGLIQVLVNVTRLEEGQSTENSLRLTLSADDAMDRIKVLRAQGAGGGAIELETPGDGDAVRT